MPRAILPLFIHLFAGTAAQAADPPVVPDEISPNVEVLQPGLKLSLVVEHPDIVTPTGIDVDDQGKIWAVASHTHFRPDPYDGPENDEVLVFDADGSNRRVFYSGTVATMDLELGPNGWVYLAERDRIVRIRDTNGDGTADQTEDIAVLETEADYPHNGLSGMYWDEKGRLVFALGENYWNRWTLTGTDDRKVTGTGEGGIFRCSADGKELHRIAKGFWNPFGICVREDGEIFAAENDPGSRPPCRMIHVVEGGDYGYNRRYGNAPFHPFIAWNGELPGTLPMLHPSGEAPCGVLPLGGGLISGSWSDNRVDFYPLHRRGASFATGRVPLVAGSEHFRPTCFAWGPDGAVYFTDWTLTFYHLHQRGRIWKLEIDEAEAATWLRPASIEPPNEAALLAEELRTGTPNLPLDRLLELCRDREAPFLARAALMQLSRRDLSGSLQWQGSDAVSAVLAQQLATPENETFGAAALNHASPRVQFEALRWIANEDLVGFREEVDQFLSRPDLSYSLFEAALATHNTLAGKSDQGIADAKMLLSRIRSPETHGRIRAYALRLMRPGDSRLTPSLLRNLLAQKQPALRLEVCRVLASRSDDQTLPIVTKHLQSDQVTDNEASFLVLRLAAAPQLHSELLKKLTLNGSLPTASVEAERALRGANIEETPATPDIETPPPFTDTDAWLAAIGELEGEPDLKAGERLFFHPRYGRCSTCHRRSGRGRIVGPDLSAIGQRGDRRWLLRSILEPQADVSAQFHPRSVTMNDGSSFVGFLLRSGGRSGKEFYRDIHGEEVALIKTDITERTELQISLMPTGLLTGLSMTEVRDLIGYLESTD